MDKLTVNEAAQRLGTSTEAVRQRIRRGQLQTEKVDGRIYVMLASSDTDTTDTTGPLPPGPNGARLHHNGMPDVSQQSPVADQTASEPLSEADQTVSESSSEQPPGGDRTASEQLSDQLYRELIETLRQENTRLWEELSIRDEEIRRRDHIIAALTERIPELPARTASVDVNGHQQPQAAGRPWWRFWSA